MEEEEEPFQVSAVAAQEALTLLGRKFDISVVEE